MENFWEYSVWGSFNVVAILLLSLLVANMLKRAVPALKESLIPTSVLGGLLLLVIAEGYRIITGNVMFDEPFFGGKGIATMEVFTYHALALGFIASAFKSSNSRLTKKRRVEILNTGMTTVATYLLQAFVGFGITMAAAGIVKEFFPAAGILLPFGYGQGTGQALNYGNIFEQDFGFVGGKSFGLTVAALGFLSASIGGVIHLSVMKRRGVIKVSAANEQELTTESIQGKNEIPMEGSMDKLTVQLAIVAFSYLLAYLMMYILGLLLPGMRNVIYGFNFILGVAAAAIVKVVLRKLEEMGLMRQQHTNSFLMVRCSNFFFDIMVVAGIAAIRLSILEQYWGIILILGLAGLFITYYYNRLVARLLFKEYEQEQFLAMYGMLTGTASTGVILLREIDGQFKTPAADNIVFQNLPAIVFGFPMMVLPTLAPVKPALTMIIIVVFFVVMNILLFRSFIFKKKEK